MGLVAPAPFAAIEGFEAVPAPATGAASVTAIDGNTAHTTGDLNANHTVTITVSADAPLTVDTTGGTPRLALSDGGFANFTGGSKSEALVFTYTVQPGQNTTDLKVTSLDLHGGSIRDVANIDADLSGHRPIPTSA